MRPGKDGLQAAHPADVLLAAQVVDHDSRGEEEQRLEEGVRHQVEDREAVRPDPRAEEHVADLGHRRVGDHSLDVPLHERDEARDQERHRAEDRREALDVGRRFEDRMRPHEQVHAGRHHRRRMDQGGDGRRALHRVREPGVQRDLGRLRDCAAEQPEGDEVHRGVGEPVHLARRLRGARACPCSRRGARSRARRSRPRLRS